MPHALQAAPLDRKRKLIECESTALSLGPPAKRQQPSFQDSSSQQLTCRAFQEVDQSHFDAAIRIPSPGPGSGTNCLGEINLVSLRRFARQGGPDLCDLRGFPHPPIVHSSSTTMNTQSASGKRQKTGQQSGTTPSSRKSSAYDPAFRQELMDNGIFIDDTGPEPDNWMEIHERLTQRRRSLSPSRFTMEDLKAFRKTNREPASESKTMSAAFPLIVGTHSIPYQTEILFNNVEDWAIGNINTAKPDWYDGSSPAELDRGVRQKLSQYIVPSTDTSLPLLPNFFTEGKGPDGSTRILTLSAMRDGALGARGIQAIRSYIDAQSAYDGNAYTITATYEPSGYLTLYTTHAMRVTGKSYQVEYRMTLLRAFAMIDSPETFRAGATVARNARDLMKEIRDRYIFDANSKAQESPSSGLQSRSTLQTDDPHQPDSDTSTDELAVSPTQKPLPPTQKQSV